MSGTRLRGRPAGLLAAWWLVMAMVAAPVLAAGSWVASVPGVRVALAEREVASRSMVPPQAADGTIDSVGWQYRLPPGGAVRARLCHVGGCITLGAGQGSSRALAGLPADTPLHFRFALAPGQRRAVAVQGLQVIVNYH